MKLFDILRVLDGIAPFDLAEKWDNVGLIVGDAGQEIRKAIISLDPGLDVISKAEETGCDLIITHHPLFIEPLKNLNLKDATALKAGKLLKAGISLVAMHTNLDAAEDGVADMLARALGLSDIESKGYFRVGTIEAAPLSDWVKTLPFKNSRITDAGKPAGRIAACPGSGMSLWREVLDAGCDTIVTGDVKYHSAIEAFETGLNVVDLGHYETESLIVEPFAERLSRLLSGVEISPYTGRDIFITI
ncbi:MAG TPA: Nif3-like dinuclear metal center hexameric protein [Desulfomonilia bacterium]|jgi:dinuclear metal center YbgI/SA1388 family protein